MALRRPAASRIPEGSGVGVAYRCPSLCSWAICRQACSKISRRLSGQPPLGAIVLVSILSVSGFLRSASIPCRFASSMKSWALRAAFSDDSSIFWIPESSRLSRDNTTTLPPGATSSRCFRSLCPSQSAARHERRRKEGPESSCSRRCRIWSKGVITFELPARISSSPSMNKVSLRHSGCWFGWRVQKLRAVTRQA